MFGILEAGRGLMDTIVAFCALGIFSAFGSNAAGLRAAILFYAIVPGVIAIIAFFLLDDDKKGAAAPEKAEAKKGKEPGGGTILRALKNKNIWLVSFNVFFVYSVYCGLTYFIPFLSDVYLLSATLVGVYGIINQYALKMLGGPIGGFITDKVLHSATKYLSICFVIVQPVHITGVAVIACVHVAVDSAASFTDGLCPVKARIIGVHAGSAVIDAALVLTVIYGAI